MKIAKPHNSAPKVTTRFIDFRFNRPGIDIAPMTAPMPKLAERSPKPPAPKPS
jgi:hypothetical protein